MNEEEFKKQSEAILKAIQPQLELIKQMDFSWIKQISSVIKPFQRVQLVVDSFYKNMAPMLELIKNIESTEKFYEEFGWLELLSWGYGSELEKKLKEEGKEGVWKQLIEDFGDPDFITEFEQKLLKKSFFQKRIHILNKALQHHQNKDYISSIPLLLSQIEGIFWDLGQKEGLIENRDNSKYLIDIKGNIIKDARGSQIECSLGDLLVKLFGKDSKLAQHTTNQVYSKNLRHPILHGRNTDYDNEITSTMLILILFMLNEEINEKGLVIR